jgi:hypothetical protein
MILALIFGVEIKKQNGREKVLDTLIIFNPR